MQEILRLGFLEINRSLCKANTDRYLYRDEKVSKRKGKTIILIIFLDGIKSYSYTPTNYFFRWH
jgi:hypothetical protein